MCWLMPTLCVRPTCACHSSLCKHAAAARGFCHLPAAASKYNPTRTHINTCHILRCSGAVLFDGSRLQLLLQELNAVEEDLPVLVQYLVDARLKPLILQSVVTQHLHTGGWEGGGRVEGWKRHLLDVECMQTATKQSRIRRPGFSPLP